MELEQSIVYASGAAASAGVTMEGVAGSCGVVGKRDCEIAPTKKRLGSRFGPVTQEVATPLRTGGEIPAAHEFATSGKMRFDMAGEGYPKLKAPKGDGQTLLWPAGPALLDQTRENHRGLGEAQQVRLCGLPLPRVRTWQRRWLGHPNAEQPLVATGHQTELYHPGVWVKNLAIESAARRVDGVAMHFSVDTDAPKHLELRWPGGGEPITDDPQLHDARWSGLLHSPGPQHIQTISARLIGAAAAWGHEPVAGQFLDCLLSLTGPRTQLPTALAGAHHHVDRHLGLRYQSLVCSPMWQSIGYLVFAYHLLSQADGFAAAYNHALADFRREQGIRSPGRPMPDLPVDGDFCEVPFWFDSLADGFRKRATVVRSGSVWTLRADDDVFEFAPSTDGWAAGEALQRWLAQHKLRLSPRALTLTTFLRLCVVDQFIHGIGGGLYDQVTDRLIRDWFGMAPPAFAVATATMLFPAAAGREQVCLHCLRQEGRRLRFASLGARRQELVGRIEGLPRRSTQRRQVFSQLQRELTQAAETNLDLAGWRDRYQRAVAEHDLEQAIFDRELPYTIQSRPRLEAMIAQFESMFQ